MNGEGVGGRGAVEGVGGGGVQTQKTRLESLNSSATGI